MTMGMTPDEYETRLVRLEERLSLCLHTGQMDDSLREEIELLIGMKEEFPEIFERHSAIEPLIGDILSSEVRNDFFKRFIPPVR